MHQRQIGDVKVSALGLGGMPMSIEGRPGESRSIATIHAALQSGITLIDIRRRHIRGAGRHQGRPPASR
jgi:aryl-alcohol dehydrogenase-like predicted oxidoreductase